MSERQSERVELFQGALTYEDERFAGFDAAVLMEVVEHVDPPRLEALERVVFGAAKPGAVIVTTPNCEYNVLYDGLVGLRHPDHRFEWDRRPSSPTGPTASPRRTATRSSDAASATSTTRCGTPTQMAIFTRQEGGR